MPTQKKSASSTKTQVEERPAATTGSTQKKKSASSTKTQVGVAPPSTGSHYESTNLPANDPHRRIAVRDADSQVRRAPAERAKGRGYPKPHNNRENNSLASQTPRREFPLKPNTTEAYSGGPPGPVRAIYNENDRATYDVVYHDPTKPAPLDFSQATRK